MPIYQFRCLDCEREQDRLLRSHEDVHDVTCLDCGSGRLRKLVSASNFALKGGGWYKDGYTKEKS